MSGRHDYFDEPVAAAYDEHSAEMFDPAVLGPTVDVLESFARSGTEPAALELAVGTGRVALPLAERGVRVVGIDLSEAMLERLRVKPGAASVTTFAGDMTTSRVLGTFPLVYLVFNTIGNVITQDDQVAVFENAARHLAPGGRFVVEVGVPQLQRVPLGERHHVFSHTETHLGVDEYDVATQRLWSHHHHFDGATGRRGTTPFRYVWPAELDLMARIAGMRLEHRWAGWDRADFTSDSASHVSVWRKDG